MVHIHGYASSKINSGPSHGNPMVIYFKCIRSWLWHFGLDHDAVSVLGMHCGHSNTHTIIWWDSILASTVPLASCPSRTPEMYLYIYFTFLVRMEHSGTWTILLFFQFSLLENLSRGKDICFLKNTLFSSFFRLGWRCFQIFITKLMFSIDMCLLMFAGLIAMKNKSINWD